MRRIALAIAIILPLTACGQEPEKQALAQQPAAEADQPPAPQPGQYRVVMKVNKGEFPGMTGTMSDRARAVFGETAQTSEYCLTPEDAGKGRADYYRRTIAKGNCKYERLNLTAKSIDAVLVCQTGQGMTARNEVSGSFTAARSDLSIKSLSQVPGGEVIMEAAVSAERIGDCN